MLKWLQLKHVNKWLSKKIKRINIWGFYNPNRQPHLCKKTESGCHEKKKEASYII